MALDPQQLHKMIPPRVKIAVVMACRLNATDRPHRRLGKATADANGQLY